jgi:hypothetical protein
MPSGRSPDRRQNLVLTAREEAERSSRTRAAGSRASSERNGRQMPALAPQIGQTGQHVAGRHQARAPTQSDRLSPASASTGSRRSIDRETSGTGTSPRAPSRREAATLAGAVAYPTTAVVVNVHLQSLPSDRQARLTEVETMAAADRVSALDAHYSREYVWCSHRINMLAREVNSCRDSVRHWQFMHELERQMDLENQLYERLSETVIGILSRQ